MNGEDKKYLTIELTRLKTQFDERWRAHDVSAHERQRIYLTKIDNINESLGEFKKQAVHMIEQLNSLPCGENRQKTETLSKDLDSIKNNDLKHLNTKINSILFMVILGGLGSLAIAALKILGFQF